MANPEHLNMLALGKAGWNTWKQANAHLYIDLCQVKTLTNKDFSSYDFSGVCLRESWLDASNLSGANLRNADLGEASLNSCHFEKADLSGATMRLAKLDNAKMENAVLVATNLNEAVLSGANLDKANLSKANLSYAYMHKAQMNGANLTDADISNARVIECEFGQANLTGASFSGTNLIGSNFSKANLANSNLFRADCYKTNFSHADLTGANLENANFVETVLEQAILSNCNVYGLSAWNVNGIPKSQTGLVITPGHESSITVDDLQVAQFIYLLLKRDNLRNVIDTITSKVVLLLGRFTPDRKDVLDTMAEQLRKHNLLPVIFDFERSPNRDFTETIQLLAGMSLFIIADISNPKSAPLELQAIIPDFKIPFIPVIQEGEAPFSMFSDLLGKYDWVLGPVITYTSKEQLIAGFKTAIIDRAWKKHQELQAGKNAFIQSQSIEQFAQPAN